MNCRPGDLAVIVASQRNIRNIGCFVTVLHRGHDWGSEPTWVTTPSADGHAWSRDSVLRPIRDPGDDAVDETLLWRPVPSEKQPA